MLPGYVYHITHRCVDKEFLLRFAKDRQIYFRWLREGMQRYKVTLYAYCITCNHVHILAHVDKTENAASCLCRRRPELSEALAIGSQAFIQQVQAQYNRRFSFETEIYEDDSTNCTWVLRECEPSYNVFSSPRNSR